MRPHGYDAVVVGSGPNGLAAAITLARAGRSVLVYEAERTIGGSARSMELTLPGLVHDVCSAVHPLALSSPFFRCLPLAEHRLEWIQPPAPLAHALDDGQVVMLERSVETTAAGLGQDAGAYERLMTPLVATWQQLLDDLLGPLRLPRHPLLLLRFGAHGLLPARSLAARVFKSERARALFAGLAAHSMLPLDRPLTSAFGLVLAMLAHVVGWPVARGGSQRIADALASYFRSLGGEIVTGVRIGALDELPPTRAVLCDVTPRQLSQLAGVRLPERYRRALARYRYGVGAFKVDWALDGPIPWRSSECRRAGTVHVGGSFSEIQASERAPWRGEATDRPFVLVAQQSLFDSARVSPGDGRQTAWAYCHVPHGSAVDMTERIESQIERFAPGFRARVLARHVMPPAELERHNPNLVGGDINGGVQDLRQLFSRPTLRTYSTPIKGLYLCSSSTPPGGGVHGMCGYFAAQAALRDLF